VGARNGIQDANLLPMMVCTSFGVEDGIEGAAYLKKVHDALFQRGKIGNLEPAAFWNERIVFATNPPEPGFRHPGVPGQSPCPTMEALQHPVPPVMFTELGSSIEQTHGEVQQASGFRNSWRSKPGSSNGMMLGACVFLNEERPWKTARRRAEAATKYPQWDPKGWWWLRTPPIRSSSSPEAELSIGRKGLGTTVAIPSRRTSAAAL